MRFFVVFLGDGSGARLSSNEFPTRKAATEFIEWRIEELLDQGVAYVVLTDRDAKCETRYSAARLADCVFVQADWRYAIMKDAA